MKIKFYYARYSGAMAVRILIHELNLPCDFIAVNNKSLKTENNEDFLTINPKGILPTIITEDNLVLTENQVIQQYLADKYGAKHGSLLPLTSDFKRYQVLEWLNYCRVDLYNIYALLINKDIPKDLKESLFKPMLQKKLIYPNTSLQDKSYLMGDKFTIADCYLFVILVLIKDPSKDLKIDLSEFSNLEKYFSLLKQRPSIATSLQEQNLIF